MRASKRHSQQSSMQDSSRSSRSTQQPPPPAPPDPAPRPNPPLSSGSQASQDSQSLSPPPPPQAPGWAYAGAPAPTPTPAPPPGAPIPYPMPQPVYGWRPNPAYGAPYGAPPPPQFVSISSGHPIPTQCDSSRYDSLKAPPRPNGHHNTGNRVPVEPLSHHQHPLLVYSHQNRSILQSLFQFLLQAHIPASLPRLPFHPVIPKFQRASRPCHPILQLQKSSMLLLLDPRPRLSKSQPSCNQSLSYHAAHRQLPLLHRPSRLLAC